ncbi:hypothetical protein [Xanthomonas arboricola]|uniref:hypothetical protein n=1 Tax=Xanthomonas arboricola TaxID=56448 RepID=UPI0011B0EB45|nr:hypothetical protein [Xanthomonas arboricola]
MKRSSSKEFLRNPNSSISNNKNRDKVLFTSGRQQEASHGSHLVAIHIENEENGKLNVKKSIGLIKQKLKALTPMSCSGNKHLGSNINLTLKSSS